MLIIDHYYTYLEYSGVKTISISLWIRASLGHHRSNAVRRSSITTVTFKEIVFGISSKKIEPGPRLGSKLDRVLGVCWGKLVENL